ncbi:hypothetical protein [Oceanirhabdus seepicola]|uniref:Uncharacterized protein n=1 Tax=Oceanirhabdus seepicola TaxID=2828781 RepID=A0A9J6NZZ7_9CLOT|nr:hypothetical protein [Oceanirhabdus seepicola]MCM1989189.1 hypothetical protein [Oceanirhabdus seepicola]
MNKCCKENRYTRNRHNDLYDDCEELEYTRSTDNFDRERGYSNNRCSKAKKWGCGKENVYKKEVQFWTGCSIQHIELLIGSNGVFGVVLSRKVEKVLEEVNNEFCHIIELLGCYKSDAAKIVKQFLKVNACFIKVLNRIMFEEYLGASELFEVVNHFMIEQIYAARVFVDKKRSPQYKAKRNVLGPDFYVKEGFGESKLERAYNIFYFWNIISAQHASILENIITYNNCDVPRKFYCGFDNFKKAYISLNRKFGEYFETMSIIKLKSIGTDMLNANMEFLSFLYSLTPLEIGTFLPRDTPEAFFDFKEHVIEEQEYICEGLKRWIYTL